MRTDTITMNIRIDLLYIHLNYVYAYPFVCEIICQLSGYVDTYLFLLIMSE